MPVGSKMNFEHLRGVSDRTSIGIELLAMQCSKNAACLGIPAKTARARLARKSAVKNGRTSRSFSWSTLGNSRGIAKPAVFF
jgi:hypothetical protein